VCLSIALVAGLSLHAQAQSAPRGASAAAKPRDVAKEPAKAAAPADANKGSTKKDAPAPEAGAEAEKPAAEAAPQLEVFKDPNTAKILAKRFPSLQGIPPTEREKRLIKGMAANAETLDPNAITKYVAGLAADLTNQGNVKALADPGAVAPGSRAAHAIRDAGVDLFAPIESARAAGNAEFLRIYHLELLKVLPGLLANNIFARIEAIIVLGKLGIPETLDIFIKTLDDSLQSVWVKLWAAKGIYNIVQTPAGNRVDSVLGAAKAKTAAQSLAAFLNREKDAPWPAKLRALEALGAVRLAARPEATGKVEMATAVAQQLADADAKVEVRAEAASALAMLRLTAANRGFNYTLVGHFIGQVAAELADRVAASYADNPVRAQYWTSLLLDRIYPSLYGQQVVPDSGLLRVPALGGGDRKFLTELGDRVRPVMKSSVELIKAPKGQQPQIAKGLKDRIGALRAFLDKNEPSNLQLIPGGDKFPLKPQVAVGVPGEKPRLAGAAGRP
jgi:hypothetical protein